MQVFNSFNELAAANYVPECSNSTENNAVWKAAKVFCEQFSKPGSVESLNPLLTDLCNKVKDYLKEGASERSIFASLTAAGLDYGQSNDIIRLAKE